MNNEIITSYLLGKKAGGGGTPPVYEEKDVSITQNGDTTITADDGYDAISKVNLSVNVPQPSGKITITQNGTDIDVSSYATADVNVSGSIPTTPDECTTSLKNVFTSYANYIDGLKANRETYTNNSVVLYTPNINCKHYFVRYRNGSYSVVWLNNWMVLCKTGNFNPAYMNASYMQSIVPSDDLILNSGAAFHINSSSSGAIGYYSNQTFSTAEEAVQAIINNQITYIQGSGASYGYDDLAYSNSHIFVETTSQKWDYKNTKIISHNETIQVIS